MRPKIKKDRSRNLNSAPSGPSNKNRSRILDLSPSARVINIIVRHECGFLKAFVCYRLLAISVLKILKSFCKIPANYEDYILWQYGHQAFEDISEISVICVCSRIYVMIVNERILQNAIISMADTRSQMWFPMT